MKRASRIVVVVVAAVAVVALVSIALGRSPASLKTYADARALMEGLPLSRVVGTGKPLPAPPTSHWPKSLRQHCNYVLDGTGRGPHPGEVWVFVCDSYDAALSGLDVLVQQGSRKGSFPINDGGMNQNLLIAMHVPSDKTANQWMHTMHASNPPCC